MTDRAVQPPPDPDVPRPLTDREVRTFRWGYGKEPDLAYEVARFTTHRYAPRGYQCSGNPCRCGLDTLIEGLKGRKRVTPPVALDRAEQRAADRKAVAR
jgi:hypothetical protein